MVSANKVKLTASEYKDREMWDADFLMSLDVDRLLFRFRKNAGLENNANCHPYGGWEGGELGGHSLGHFLTAMSYLYSNGKEVNGQESTVKGRINSIVETLSQCQEKTGSGFIGAYDEGLLDRHEKTGQGWAPYYTMHKILQGLIDAYRLTDNEKALTVASRLGDYVYGRTQKITDMTHWNHIQDLVEVGGIAEALINLYGYTHKEEHLKAGQFFHQMDKLTPSSEGKDVLEGPQLVGNERNRYPNFYHSNTTIPQFIAALADYRVTKNEMMLRAAENFWTNVVEHRTYSNGATGYHEHWNKPQDKLSEELGFTAGETCCTYNLIKLSNDLFCVHPDVKYAEYVEKAMINHIMGSIEPKTSNFMYFHTEEQGSFKTFGRNDECFWCCTGSGMENHQRYGESIYFEQGDTLTINQFIASTLSFRSLELEQHTAFPLEEKTVITINKGSGKYCLKIRAPKWCNNFEITVNGQEPSAKNKDNVAIAPRNGYVYINRTWKEGDKIEVSLPMHLYTVAMKDNPDIATVMYGSMVLAADLGNEGITPQLVASTENMFSRVPDEYKVNIVLPQITGKMDTPNKWLKKEKGELLFRTTKTDTKKELTFRPLYQIYASRFSDYLKFR